MDEGPILLSVVLPDGEELTVRCDSVRFTVPDSADGRIQGGSVGIRKGHASALMAVASGAVTAFSAGKQVFSRSMGGGLATVEGDRVTILTFETETA